MRKEKISTTSAKSKDTDGDSPEWIAECLECPLDEYGDKLLELEEHGDWDGVKAWAAMPKYKGGDSDA